MRTTVAPTRLAATTITTPEGRTTDQDAVGQSRPFETVTIAALNTPWALAFLPDRRVVVTEKAGRLLLLTSDGSVQPVGGVPPVSTGVQIDPHLARHVVHGRLRDVLAAGETALQLEELEDYGESETGGAALVRQQFDFGLIQSPALDEVFQLSLSAHRQGSLLPRSHRRFPSTLLGTDMATTRYSSAVTTTY